MVHSARSGNWPASQYRLELGTAFSLILTMTDIKTYLSPTAILRDYTNKDFLKYWEITW